MKLIANLILITFQLPIGLIINILVKILKYRSFFCDPKIMGIRYQIQISIQEINFPKKILKIVLGAGIERKYS